MTRKRDPGHLRELAAFVQLTPTQQLAAIGIADHQAPGFVRSEVLAMLVRSRFGQGTGTLAGAARTLNERIQVLAGRRMNRTELPDAIQYIWLKFLDDESPVPNSEVRFAVFVRDRVDDYVRHLLTEKNTMLSTDAIEVTDEDGNATPFIATVADDEGDSPEQALIRKRLSVKANAALMALPREERDAFYLRGEMQYGWGRVAELLHCSVPTARKHFNNATKKLEGVDE